MKKMNIEVGDWAIAPPGKYNSAEAGKKYKILEICSDKTAFCINIRSSGYDNLCLLKGCSHLNGKNWIIEKANKTKIYELWI
jgi:hypothetical protein